MAYDAAHSVVMLFGGGNLNGPNCTMNGDTWTWDGKWAQQNPASSPSPRQAEGMDYDAFIGQTVLFGGEFESSNCQSPNTYYNDTWYWNGSNWAVQSSPTASPTARGREGFAYDPATKTIVLNGGLTPSNYLNDTWSY